MVILHLSDIHFGRNNPAYKVKGSFDDKEKILDSLIDCICSSKMRPDHIIFTGDIAWYGKTQDFEEAYIWLTKLLNALELTGRDITFCAGNHDVNRSYLNYNRNLDAENIALIDEAYDYANIYKMEAPKKNYNVFCSKLGVVPFHYPVGDGFESSFSIGYKDIDFNNRSLRIYSFDTSLFSTLPDINPDNMYLGLPQIKALIENGMFDTESYKIAIFHHAERFLHPNELCEYNNRIATLPLLRDCVNLVLCGHTETGGKPVLYTQDEGAATLTSGAAYYDDKHQNAFCFVEILKDKSINLYPYSFEHSKWGEYEYKRKYNVKTHRKLPEVFGKLAGRGTFGFLSMSNGEFSIPLNAFSLYEPINGMVEGNNYDDPIRQIDIACKAPTIKRGNASFDVKAPRTSENDVSAAVALENLFEYLAKIDKDIKNSFYMKNEKGQVFFSGENVKAEDYTQNVEYYRKLLKLEKYFDVAFCRPNSVTDEDEKTVDQLIEFIDRGYAEIGSLNTCSAGISDVDKLLSMAKAASKIVYLRNTHGKFMCKLHGAEIKFNATVISGPHTYDQKDVKKKAKTFMKGDIRSVEFKVVSGGKLYLINDSFAGTLPYNTQANLIEIQYMKLNWLNFSECKE